MRLEHVLLAMAQKQQKQLADIFGIAALSKRRDEAVATLYKQYLSPEGFSAVWNYLDRDEQRIYAVAMAEMHNDGYVVGISRARLIAAMEKGYAIASAQAGAVITKLHELGLFGYTQIWYIGDGYEIPVELTPFVRMAVAQAVAVAPIDHADEVRVAFAYGRMLSRDAVRLAARVASKPLLLTKQGTVYKREIARLKPYLRCVDSAGIAMTGPLEDVPFALHLCMRLLEVGRALLIREGVASLHASQATALLSATQEQWDKLIEQTATEILDFGHTHIFHILHHVLNELPAGEWFALEHLLGQALGDSSPLHGWRHAVRHYVRVMALCGKIDVGVHAGVGEVARVRPHADDGSAGHWIVQPNLELLVPEAAPPVLHFLAGQIGELHRADEMSAYRLTKASILQLCDRGWTGRDIEVALQTFSQVPIAQGVERTIRDWVSEYDKAVLWDVLLVRFTSPVLLEAFAADPRGRKVMVDRVGDAAAIVRRSAEKTVREVLSDIGAPPPQGLRTPVDEVQASEGKMRKGDTKANQVGLRKLLSPDLIEVARQRAAEAVAPAQVGAS